MKKEYDFSKGRRGAVIRNSRKTRITIYLDDEIIEACRAKADTLGIGYQTLINLALREWFQHSKKPVDEEALRAILREELERVS